MHLYRNKAGVIASCVAFGVAMQFLAATALAQAPIRYEISFENAAHREARISVTFTHVDHWPLEARMSRSSPGRYAIHEFGKNVYDVSAFDAKGAPLPISRPDPYQWNVDGHDGTVRLEYTLFADRAGGTYSQVNAEHAHLNAPATFMWARGLHERPIELTIRPLDASWKVATQLEPTADPFVFRAPNFQYFMDSPTQVAPVVVRSFSIGQGADAQTIRLAVHHEGTDADVDAYAEMAKAVVAEQIAIYGEAPRFDYGVYTFIAEYTPYASGDGMEHRNSTILASNTPLAGQGASRNLGTLSHEFFHAWNVERIRPRSLQPFDFERANMSGELWFAEGFTQYYGDLTLARAGFEDLDDFAYGLSYTIDAVVNGAGRELHSPVEMSRRAPFTDAATSIDPQNTRNIFISYYTYGAAVALGLDLTLRGRFNRSLDDYMRAVWAAHGKTEIPYTIDDLERRLAELTGDAAFAAEFFARFVHGRDAVDYAALLEPAGFVARKSNPGGASLGATQIGFVRGRAVVSDYAQRGSPLYRAGIDRGDAILSIGGRAISNQATLQSALRDQAPGQSAAIESESFGRRKSARVTFIEDPALEVVTFESAGRPVTDAIRAFRQRWVGSRAGRNPRP
jgi:predicted metalloprotease with PDZ domain